MIRFHSFRALRRSDGELGYSKQMLSVLSGQCICRCGHVLDGYLQCSPLTLRRITLIARPRWSGH
uniref:Uncharacterized protein n=1 Tax=Rhizophora mucronata TaxID=61149 RepID=A0A2P2Q8B1_RHIMU